MASSVLVNLFRAGRSLACALLGVLLLVSAGRCAEPEPMPVSAEIGRLAERVSAQEARSPLTVSVRYTLVGAVTSQQYLWAKKGNRMRFDVLLGNDPQEVTQYFWDGTNVQVCTGRSEKGVFIPEETARSTDPADVGQMQHYAGWMCLQLGNQKLSDALRLRGVSVKQQGNRWVIRLRPGSPKNAYEEVVLRSDRGYRVERWTEYLQGGKRREGVVTKWVGGGSNPWLPATTEWRVNKKLFRTVQVTETVFGHQVPDDLFVMLELAPD